jgi:pimeloyl-ACP methyl ester carboxylesterase
MGRAYSTEGFTRSTWRIDGVETVVYEIGSGEPVVYFHGGGTYHGFEWARDFAASYRMILPYHPNFGESGDAPFTSVADYMLHYEMLFAAMGIERFHLMGASTGGHFAARYAGAHRDEVDRLVLNAPAGLVSQNASLPNFGSIPHEQTPEWLVADPAWLEPYWPREPSGEWMALRMRELQAVMASREDLGETHRLLHEALAGYEGPVLLLWGEKDRTVPTGFIPDWQELLPGAEVAVIPGGAHLLLDESIAAREVAMKWLGE